MSTTTAPATLRSGSRRGSAEVGTEPDRRGSVLVWAPLGVLLAGMAVAVWVQWVLSPDEFGAVGVVGPDEYPTWREVALRVTEVLSFAEMGILIWFVAIIPLRRYGRLGLDAKITAGCLLGCVSDGFLNTQAYLFAWNAALVQPRLVVVVPAIPLGRPPRATPRPCCGGCRCTPTSASAWRSSGC